MMTFNDLMGYYDFKMKNVLKGLRINRETLGHWKHDNVIPFRMQCVIQVVTDGKLLAEGKEEWLKGEKI